MRRALVTGGTGFVGSHVVDELLEHGYQVRAAVRATSNLRWLEGKDVEKVQADLATDDLDGLIEDVDVTFHVAGLTRGNAAALERANVVATRRLAEALGQSHPGSRVVFCSSLAAAGPSRLDQPRTISEPSAPDSDYGRSKLAAEQALQSVDALGLTILRPGGVYGPRDEDTLSFFKMSSMGFAATPGLRRRQIQLVHARDVALVCRLAAEADVATGRTYFVNHPEILEWPQVVQAMRGAVERPVLSLRVPSAVLKGAGLVAGVFGGGKVGTLDYRRATDMVEQAWTADVSPVMSELEWVPTFDLDTGFRNTARWYRDQGWI